jgi:hypothetical protein
LSDRELAVQAQVPLEVMFRGRPVGTFRADRS